MVPQSLSELLAWATDGDHIRILKNAEAALENTTTDLETQHIRVVALIKLDRFDDALLAFQAIGTGLKDCASLEYAYVLYKTGSLDEAEIEAAVTPSCRGMRHVLAQAVRLSF